MTTLNRAEFFVCKTADVVKAIKVEGYTFDVKVRDGLDWAYGTYKEAHRRWHLVDAVTGLAVTGPMSTRRECVEYAESNAAKERMWRYYDEHTELYRAKAEVFRRLVAGDVMTYGVYVVAVAELEAMMREERRYEEEPVVEAAAETAVVTLEDMKAKGWTDVLVRQRNEGSCIWVVGDLDEHKDELVELGFKQGRSKYYGEGWWAKPTMVE